MGWAGGAAGDTLPSWHHTAVGSARATASLGRIAQLPSPFPQHFNSHQSTGVCSFCTSQAASERKEQTAAVLRGKAHGASVHRRRAWQV